MNYQRAINYWVLGGFEGGKSAREAIENAAAFGLDGIELTYGDCIKENTPGEDLRLIRDTANEKDIGLYTLASGYYWKCSLGSPDEEERQRAVDFTKGYIQTASKLGIDRILVIPGAVDVAWDEARPVVPYRQVWDLSSRSIAELIPTAEEYGVLLCIENVWNKFLLSPVEMKIFVDQFNSDRIGVYFDVGNVIAFGYPEHWIEILGSRIKAVHIKNSKREDGLGGIHGFTDDLEEGDVDFKLVKKALGKTDYSGPLTAEMIPMCRLPQMVLPDMELAEETAAKLIKIFS